MPWEGFHERGTPRETHLRPSLPWAPPSQRSRALVLTPHTLPIMPAHPGPQERPPLPPTLDWPPRERGPNREGPPGPPRT